MDRAMRVFEREFSSGFNAELMREEALDEPAGTSLQNLKQAITEMTTHFS
jgi:hypothetical protein